MKKTNAIRILDQLKVGYEVFQYQYDSENLSVEKIASENGLDIEDIYKTLVAKGDKNGVQVAVIRGNQNLDFKALSKVSQNKKITLVPVKDLLQLTGYIRGGCSPIGMKKSYPVYIDSKAITGDQIYINAGARGLLVKLNVDDLVKVTKGKVEQISL